MGQHLALPTGSCSCLKVHVDQWFPSPWECFDLLRFSLRNLPEVGVKLFATEMQNSTGPANLDSEVCDLCYTSQEMNYFQVNFKEIQVFVADFSPEVPLSEDKLVVSFRENTINLKYFPCRCFA